MTSFWHVQLVLTALIVLTGGWQRRAGAHFVYVVQGERNAASEARLYFSESAQAAAERLPDKIAASRIWVRTLKGPVKSLSADRAMRDDQPQLVAQLAAEAPYSIEATCNYGVYQTFLLTYYAKHLQFDALDQLKQIGRSPELPLDIDAQPADQAIRLTVYWNDQPLAGAAVVLSDPSGNETQVVTDSAGQILHPVGEPGLYAARAHHVQRDDHGRYAGQDYTTAQCYTTLTLQLSATQLNQTSIGWGDLPEPIASLGAVMCDDWLYVYGGHIGAAHDHSRDNLSAHFRRSRLGAYQWEELPMQTRLQGLALVTDGRFIYRIGGVTAHNAATETPDLESVTDFARFDPREGSWSCLPPLPSGRSSHDAAVIGSRLYVSGGWNLDHGDGAEGDWHTTSLMFDLADDKSGWQELPLQPFQRRTLAACHFQGNLYVIGGMNTDHEVDRSVDVFDPRKGKWTRGPEFPGDGMNGFGVSAWNVDDRLYASGSNGNVYRLCNSADRWEHVATLQTPRFFHRLLSAPEARLSLFAVGGASIEGHLRQIERVPIANPAGSASHVRD